MRILIVIVAMVLVLGVAGVSYMSRSVPPEPSTSPLESSGQTNTDFRIEGRVINAAGEPIAGAKVFVDADDAQGALVLTGDSDEEGNFSIELHQFGNYTIYGSKEEDGYPLTVSGFHQQVTPDQIPKLRITERKPMRNVILQLGERAAKIEGIVEDASGDQAIQSASITLRRVDNPDLLYRTSTEGANPGGFNIVVPTAPFTIEVSSLGYAAWKYGDEGSRLKASRSLKLNRGEVKKLQVGLRKSADAK